MAKKKPKNVGGIRARLNGEIIELWLGEPGDAESDLIARFHEHYLEGVLGQLNNIHKVPRIPNDGWHYPVYQGNTDCGE